MSEETGIQYPTIELGGVQRDVKFSRGTLYTLEKQGIVFQPVFNQQTRSWSASFSSIVDTLKVCTGFEGSGPDLAELIFDRRDEALVTLVEAWGKVMLPSMQARLAAAAANKPAARPN